ncbi:putative cytidylate kinase [Clostridium neonatale]|uniref:cytidylate kinase-like family protein n=1 Tax=Clostridium neonatale TaxID=137838 RepID=UPI00291B7B1C|nr:cytidylate kinase-like family protein [Clostridium neonatale]CAI3241052.1 putative cytidylate kinase [Clostridium neonatale]
MKNFVIAITRTCGSGGTTIWKMISNDYDINMYDRELLRLASEDSGINELLFLNVDEHVKKSLLYKVSKKVYQGELIPPESSDFTSNDNLFNYQAKVLRELAEKESYVVIGRCADYILKDKPNVFKIFIHACAEECIKHEMERLCMNEKDAAKHIKKMDKYRSEYYYYHTGEKWEDPKNYDLSIDTSVLGFEKSVQLIKSYINLRMEN